MTTTTKAVRNSCCGFCGARFALDASWPRSCSACSNTTYRNPIPVAVLLLPVVDDVGGSGAVGVLCIRRGVAPHEGSLALPGGYVDANDASWQHAAARELFEETNVVVDASTITLFDVGGGGNTLLVFGQATPVASSSLPPFVPTPDKKGETQERVVVTSPVELAFPLHTAALAAFFRARA